MVYFGGLWCISVFFGVYTDRSAVAVSLTDSVSDWHCPDRAAAAAARTAVAVPLTLRHSLVRDHVTVFVFVLRVCLPLVVVLD